ncbi:uncharacterized protein EI97DRAFT_453917 [Westerdykella ornata]|uniref:BRCT domain-containing protein n=1 Tax=Westerdykella ornata TaxID=318751 RepID=A0A6A6JVM1_WESOR|nr:uncharacterized protein EI97DRAFT_453917 [Westerdykella ornata]KAF2280661.1 hypothetical protein EI97DRAFT_453917 [Westerdykella ornata]
MSGRNEPSQMPLAGAIVCFTAILPEERTALAAIAAEMGATIKLDLTSDVTHLIVGKIDSAKYRYVARQREDVKVLAPEWLDALRHIWIGGGHVPVAALEHEYHLPVFHRLKICLTGFDNPEQRRYVQEKAVQNGAEYHGDLTKSVTHLIAALPTGKKYEYARAWNMKVVSWEWFEQSLQRGMALDEAYYDPRMPVEERGQGAWVRRRDISPNLGKRAREPEQLAAINPLKRKLRRSVSSKLGSQSEALWAGITAVGRDRKSAGDEDWDKDELTNTASPNGSATKEGGAAAPSERISENAALHAPYLDAVDTGIFQGRPILTHGFDSEKTRILREHLASNGAFIVKDPAELLTLSSDHLSRGYVVVPHDVATDLDSVPGGAGPMTRATNWWVERCLHAKCLLDPAEHVLCRPLQTGTIPGFNGLSINATGFSGIELLHVTKVVSLMGATYHEFLSAKTSVLVCNTETPNEQKTKFIAEKRIPAVRADWLWTCLSTGQLQPYEDFLLRITPSSRASRDREQPYPDVPTVRLSEEELRKRKAPPRRGATRPTSRNGPQKPGALVLSLLTNPSPTDSSTHLDAGTVREHDGEEPGSPAIGGPWSVPPQDVRPSMNASRRPSASSTASTAKSSAGSTPTFNTNTGPTCRGKQAYEARSCRPTKEPAPDSIIPLPIEPKKDYSSIMTGILAQRRAAAEQQIAGNEVNKRKRQLGRAPSAPSNASTVDEPLSRPSSVAPGDSSARAEGEAADHSGRGEGEEEEEEEPEIEAKNACQPSQVLGWDAPGAQEARERMIKAMGGKVEAIGNVAEPIGLMKDIVSGDCGGRPARRRKG